MINSLSPIQSSTNLFINSTILWQYHFTISNQCILKLFKYSIFIIDLINSLINYFLLIKPNYIMYCFAAIITNLLILFAISISFHLFIYHSYFIPYPFAIIVIVIVVLTLLISFDINCSYFQNSC